MKWSFVALLVALPIVSGCTRSSEGPCALWVATGQSQTIYETLAGWPRNETTFASVENPTHFGRIGGDPKWPDYQLSMISHDVYDSGTTNAGYPWSGERQGSVRLEWTQAEGGSLSASITRYGDASVPDEVRRFLENVSGAPEATRERWVQEVVAGWPEHARTRIEGPLRVAELFAQHGISGTNATRWRSSVSEDAQLQKDGWGAVWSFPRARVRIQDAPERGYDYQGNWTLLIGANVLGDYEIRFEERNSTFRAETLARVDNATAGRLPAAALDSLRHGGSCVAYGFPTA